MGIIMEKKHDIIAWLIGLGTFLLFYISIAVMCLSVCDWNFLELSIPLLASGGIGITLFIISMIIYFW